MDVGVLADGRRHVHLEEVDPSARGSRDKEDAERRLRDRTEKLLELQGLVQAAERHAVLIILQGMDGAGKDRTIQQALGAANPEAIRVKHFSEMSEEEELHDFLWRAHLAAPARGEWVVFDRSYYEQIVLPQVEGPGEDDPGEQASRGPDDLVDNRCADAVAFERILRNAGTIVIKVFLHVSPEEQERRLVERMTAEETAWKISARDWTARRKWDDYMAAWERTMNATATPDAPWLIVPADDDLARDLAVADAIVARLEPHRATWIAERKRIGDRKREEAREEAPEHVKAKV